LALSLLPSSSSKPAPLMHLDSEDSSSVSLWLGVSLSSYCSMMASIWELDPL
jgi:hypothetical protein